jgi:nicotinate-nucleotide adenylyltransferase
MVSEHIGIFGTSANPPTLGHQKIVQWLLKADGGYSLPKKLSEIWVLPVYKHPFAKKELIAFKHRFLMAQFAFADFKKVKVKDIEKKIFLADKSQLSLGTIDTVKYLRDKYPKKVFHLILGQDGIEDLHKSLWKESKELLDTVPIIGVERSSIKKDSSKFILYCVPEISGLSSSKARFSRDVSALKKILPKKVFSYILENNLYSVQKTS